MTDTPENKSSIVPGEAREGTGSSVQKSNLAARFRNINMLIVILILMIMMGVSAIVTNMLVQAIVVICAFIIYVFASSIIIKKMI